MQQLLVVITSIALFGFVVKPVLFVNLYFFVRPLLQPFGNEGLLLLGFPINWPVTAATIFASVFYIIFSKRFSLTPLNSWPLILLVLASMASIMTSVDPSLSMGQTLKFINAYVMSILVANAIKHYSDVLKIYKGIVWSSAIPILYGFYQFVTNTGVRGIGGEMNRPTSVFGFSNMYGIFLVFIILSSVFLILEARRSKKYKAYPYIIILVLSVVSSIIALNRGTWIALGIAFIAAYPFYKKYLSMKWHIIAFVILTIAASGMIIKRFEELQEDRPGADTFEERISMWNAVLGSWDDVPLIGYGAGTAPIVMSNKFQINNVPHNDYIRIFLELGMIGLALYAFFLIKAYTLLMRVPRNKYTWHADYVTFVLLTYWIIISFVQNIYHNVVVFPLLLVMLQLWNGFRKMQRQGRH